MPPLSCPILPSSSPQPAQRPHIPLPIFFIPLHLPLSPILPYPSILPTISLLFLILHFYLPSPCPSSPSFPLYCPPLPTIFHTFSLILHLVPLLPPPQSLPPSCEPPPPIVTPPFSCSFTSCPVPPHTRPLAFSPSLGIHLPISLILLHLSSLPIPPYPPSVPPPSRISLPATLPYPQPSSLPHTSLSYCAFILHIPTAS